MDTTHRTPRLGIDIGRVIIDGSSHPDGGDTSFFSGDETAMLRTPAVPGAFEAIRTLGELFDGQVWLVSKCGERIRDRSLRWLAHHGFFEHTGVDPDRTRFCRERKQKRGICTDLGIDHFIDDHPEVHRALRGAVANQYLFGPQRHAIPDHVVWTPTWADVLDAVSSRMTTPV